MIRLKNLDVAGLSPDELEHERGLLHALVALDPQHLAAAIVERYGAVSEAIARRRPARYIYGNGERDRVSER